MLERAFQRLKTGIESETPKYCEALFLNWFLNEMVFPSLSLRVS